MKFSNLHLNESILRGVSFEPTMMCPCGCNGEAGLVVESDSHKVVSDLISEYYEATGCSHVLGILRTLDKETHIIFLDTDEMVFKMSNVGKQTPKQLGKTIEGFIKNTELHYIILTEEIENGKALRIVSNRSRLVERA